MLYVFTGSSQYEVIAQTHNWKKLFIEKHGDFNLTHIKNLGEVDTNFIAESLLSNSLFASKKLVIFQIDSDAKKSPDRELKQEYILKHIHHISIDTILVISYPQPDKRSRFYKEITKLADTVKIFDEKKSGDLVGEILKKYSGNISSGAATLLTRYKGENYQKIVGEIEKLLIVFPQIEEKHIKAYIVPELEESIFTLVDAILSKNKNLTIETLRIISQDSNVYLLYNSLIANLRTTYYIGILKQKKLPPQMIRDELKLGNRGFLVDKRYAMNFSEICTMYQDLVQIDRTMKTGKLVGNEETDFLFEIERVLYRYL